MKVDFDKIFNPTKQEQIDECELALKLHKSFIGSCCTCSNYVASDAPGFVTDYGTCMVCSSVFVKKICGMDNIICSLYMEDTDSFEKVVKHIEKLKGEK